MFVESLMVPRAESYPPDHDFWYSPVGTASLAGVRVDPDSAMRVSTVYACVSVISNAVAGLSVEVQERQADGGRRLAEEHPLWDVVHLSPREGMDSYFFWQTVLVHLLLRGNAYIEILPGARGFIDQIDLLHPDAMTVDKLPGRRLRYRYRDGDFQERTIPPERLWHLRGLSLDGVMGISVISYARETIGAALAAERYGATVFAQDATPGVVLTHPGKLSTEAKDRVVESWVEKHGGHWNARRPAVLPEGMDVKTVALSPEDTQWIDSRKLSAVQIAQFFGVQQHMVGLLERSTNNNIEQQSHEFVTYTIRPWVVRIERSAAVNLLADPRRFKLHFALDDLLRGDPLKRAQALQLQRQNGVINSNEWRRQEGLNPLDGPEGEQYWRPGNMVPADSPAPTPRMPQPAPQRAGTNGHHEPALIGEPA